MRNASVAALCLSLAACGGGMEGDGVSGSVQSRSSALATSLNNNLPIRGEQGSSASFAPEGRVQLFGDFATSFGQNGRSCADCHDYASGWTVSAAGVRARFEATEGLAPIFRSIDGANHPGADLSTLEARRSAFSLLLSRAVLRVGLPVPEQAEFELVEVDDPYGHASAQELSLYRRPLPSANLRFIPAVMWDGRVTGSTLEEALWAQANGATLGHAEALAPLTTEQQVNIVKFESSVTNAQLIDDRAGRLDKSGSLAGPEALQSFAMVAGRMTLFDGWANTGKPNPKASDKNKGKPAKEETPPTKAEENARLAVLRGQALFNDKKSSRGRTCLACHSVANVGTSVQARFFDIGVSSGTRRTADLPLYTFRNKATGELRTTTDPGRALITGAWADMDRFKVPSLRGLAARPPYFHNGMAATLLDVVRLYEETQGFDFTPQEEEDLVAFMRAL